MNSRNVHFLSKVRSFKLEKFIKYKSINNLSNNAIISFNLQFMIRPLLYNSFNFISVLISCDSAVLKANTRFWNQIQIQSISDNTVVDDVTFVMSLYLFDDVTKFCWRHYSLVVGTRSSSSPEPQSSPMSFTGTLCKPSSLDNLEMQS